MDPSDIKTHAFVGRLDRWCEVCNRPDRDPIHALESVSPGAKPGHDLRFCKLGDCPNELTKDDPTRGRWANICPPCRRGDTTQGMLHREQQGLSRSTPAVSELDVGPGPKTGGPALNDSLEGKAKAIVPLARKLQQKVTASRAARAEAASTVDEFSRALTELRDAAHALITS